MAARTANSSADLCIGAVYTPQKWAYFAIEQYGLLNQWLAGKTIFDPTMGEGSLLAALIESALSQGYALLDLPIANLFGVELQRDSHKRALLLFEKKYGIDMGANFFNEDILAFGSRSFDILFGNPPWCNFVDLPESYKALVKPLFIEYGLVGNAQNVLLGNSRIDIAALIVQKTIADNLAERGKAVFFLPLSLFLNDGAHGDFRKFTVKGMRYSLSSIYDFENTAVFQHITTRYGLAAFEKAPATAEMVAYFRFEHNAWQKYNAMAQKPGSPYLIPSDPLSRVIIPKIEVPAGTKPRQGINPCGAIAVFVFKHYEDVDPDTCRVNGAYLLPKKYVYPLITAHNFSDDESPSKWVLLPYHSTTGKPLSRLELESEMVLFNYLSLFQDVLSRRKGTLIQAHIKQGIWWTLMGVGAYNFSEYKVVWEAYGKASFKPKLFCGSWQANQSLQAFIPCPDKAAANLLLDQLINPAVEQYLAASRMEGTMNWAQPGKISAILQYKSHQGDLFT
jgi:hypothetical protein